CMCSYRVDDLVRGSHMEVLRRHHLVVPGPLQPAAANGSPGAVVEPAPPGAEEKESDELRRMLLRQKRVFDNVMLASDMGTWRYTLDDNVCTFDENGQRLYGLTEARFLHDRANVQSRFHPDDIELMWARVAKALDPAGDGRYEMEYRVKQPD